MKQESELNLYEKAGRIKETVESFLNSSDEEIEIEHVPTTCPRWKNANSGRSSTRVRQSIPLSVDQRTLIRRDAEKVWNAMKNFHDSRIQISHDGYLKMWQLSKPNLQDSFLHDVLMIDEGQDMNPAMLDIFQRQATTKIIVGDPWQQIYSFRGAVNALNQVAATTTFHLTQSFRFGPKIGFLANTCLEKLLGVKTQNLVGGKKLDFFRNSEEIMGNIRAFKPIAIIGRSNLKVFDEVVKIICERSDRKLVPTACFAGGLDSYKFDVLLDIFYRFKGEPEGLAKMKKYTGFNSFSALKYFAESTADMELMSKINIVESYKDRIPGNNFCF